MAKIDRQRSQPIALIRFETDEESDPITTSPSSSNPIHATGIWIDFQTEQIAKTSSPIHSKPLRSITIRNIHDHFVIKTPISHTLICRKPVETISTTSDQFLLKTMICQKLSTT